MVEEIYDFRAKRMAKKLEPISKQRVFRRGRYIMEESIPYSASLSVGFSCNDGPTVLKGSI